MKISIPLPVTIKRRILAAILGIIIILASGTYLYYSFESASLHDAAAHNLQAIGDLKIGQIVQWRKERIANARTTFRSTLLADAAVAWLRQPADTVLREKIANRLLLVKTEYVFNDIFMVSLTGKVLLTLDDTTNKIGPREIALLADALQAPDVFERDFYISSIDHNIYYDIIAPIRTAKNEAVALLIFRTDPDDYLYPLIRRWPTPSGSSETVLIRKNGDSIIYLNDLRFKDHTALTLKIPITRTDLPAVQAALGTRGIYDGYDYRGVHTLSYLASIPNTPWLMVAKIDYSEILAELSYRAVILAVISGIVLLLIVSVFAVYYRSYQLQVFAQEREAERQLLESREKLRKREQEYRTLVEKLDEGFCVIEMIFDAEGKAVNYRFVEVNPAFENQTGFHQALGKTVRELIPDFDAYWFEMYGKVAQTGESIRFQAPVTATQRHYDVFAYRMGGEGSKKVGVLFSDITEHLKMEKLLRDVQRREAIGVLSAGIAHDFNNLLAVMMGNVSLAQLQMPASHPASKYMEQSMKAIESAAELTRQILAFSGKGHYQMRTVDLAEEIRTHVNLFTVSIPKNVRLITQLPDTPVHVSGDPGQFKQIIMNLIINGADAIGDRQGNITIALSTVDLGANELRHYSRITNTILKEGRYGLLEVTDTGHGMSAETQEKIFDPFFTTKFLGRGLGLSAVLGIVRSHNGGIAIDSAEGDGTIFRVILPSSSDHEAKAEAAAEESLPLQEEHPTILVIDDEETVASMACEVLELENFPVLMELNPIRGIELYRQRGRDIGLVLLDLTMPEMSGEKVVDRLREINPEVRIIISSGYSETEVIKRIGGNTVTGFIQKPYRIDSLVAAVTKALRKQ